MVYNRLTVSRSFQVTGMVVTFLLLTAFSTPFVVGQQRVVQGVDVGDHMKENLAEQEKSATRRMDKATFVL